MSLALPEVHNDDLLAATSVWRLKTLLLVSIRAAHAN